MHCTKVWVCSPQEINHHMIESDIPSTKAPVYFAQMSLAIMWRLISCGVCMPLQAEASTNTTLRKLIKVKLPAWSPPCFAWYREAKSDLPQMEDLVQLTLYKAIGSRSLTVIQRGFVGATHPLGFRRCETPTRCASEWARTLTLKRGITLS
jgi:hypothetical protein